MFDSIIKCYDRLRLISYRGLFHVLRERDSSLSAAEAYSVDVTYLLHGPTVKEFADCLGISQPNATYKINHLIQKGYVEKIPSQEDRREIHLHVTDKYMRYWNESSSTMHRAVTILEERFSEEEMNVFSRMLETLADALPREQAPDL